MRRHIPDITSPSSVYISDDFRQGRLFVCLQGEGSAHASPIESHWQWPRAVVLAVVLISRLFPVLRHGEQSRLTRSSVIPYHPSATLPREAHHSSLQREILLPTSTQTRPVRGSGEVGE